jgi:hypothetical protein
VVVECKQTGVNTGGTGTIGFVVFECKQTGVILVGLEE